MPLATTRRKAARKLIRAHMGVSNAVCERILDSCDRIIDRELIASTEAQICLVSEHTNKPAKSGTVLALHLKTDRGSGWWGTYPITGAMAAVTN